MYCPNPECPDRLATGRPSEYREGFATCPVCQTPLEQGSWEDAVAQAPPQPPDAQDEVELLRTADPGEVAIVAGALEQEGVAFWRRTIGPGKALLAAGQAMEAPGVEHALYVPADLEGRAQRIKDEVLQAVPDLSELVIDDEPMEEEMPSANPSTASRVLAFVVRAVVLALMLLGFVAVIRMLT